MAKQPAARELRARRDLRWQPGQRQQRRALAEGYGRRPHPRGVLVPAAIVPANRVAVPAP